MDGDSFDRLSVGVHRLREGVTRRGAMGVLFGGLLAAVGVNADETDARRRRRKKKKKGCKGFGGRCSSNRDCCNGRCQGRFCFPNGGGGGGSNCGGRRCPAGQRCCRLNGFDICVFDNDPRCFNDTCPIGWERCGGAFQCCGPDQQCCNNGRCCPDARGWHCGNIACEFRGDDRAAGEPEETRPFEDPITVEAED